MRFNPKKYVLMVLIGILISLIIDVIIPYSQPDHNKLYDFALSIFLTITIWEGNLYLDRRLNEKLAWVKKPIIRLITQLPLCAVFSALIIYLVMFLYNKYVCILKEDFKSILVVSSITIGTLFSIILITIEVSFQFFTNWKTSLTEVEKYKTESVQAQLQDLKNQVNPHFLFNNLSVLSSLVYKDQDKAVDFINQLSKVYRCLLDNRNNELIPLVNELTFINSYNYLLQIRYDKNIVFKLDINDKYLNKLIPPSALQMLIENAIKHNEISNEQPLTIHVFVSENYLVVSNNLQLRSSHEPSSKLGLLNIRDRYKHFTNLPIEITQNEHAFIVKIPLLETE